MKTLRKIVFASLALSICSPSATAHTLTEAIRLALETNPELLSAKAALSVAEEQLNSARAAYLPTIDLSLSAGDESTNKPGSDRVDMWKQDHSLTLTQTVFDGGSTDSTVERSEETYNQAVIRLDDLTGTITLNVIESWYELYKLQRIAQMTQRNVAQHSKLFSQTQQKVEVGASSKAELTAVEGPYIGALTAQASNRGQLADAVTRYTKVVGEAPEGALPDPVPLLTEVVLPATVDEAVELAISMAAAIRTAESNLLAAEADHRGSKASFFPTVDFEYKELLKNDVSGTEGVETGWSAVFNVTYTLYNGGADSARRRETAQALIDSREQLSLAQRTAEEGVRIAWSALQVSNQILGLNQRNMKSATETLQSTQEQFKLGEVEMVAVMGAEDGLFQARQSVLTERVTGTLSRLRLLSQLGLLKLPETVMEEAVEDGDGETEAAEEQPQVDEPAGPSEMPGQESGETVGTEQHTSVEDDLVERIAQQGDSLIQQIESMLNQSADELDAQEADVALQAVNEDSGFMSDDVDADNEESHDAAQSAEVSTDEAMEEEIAADVPVIVEQASDEEAGGFENPLDWIFGHTSESSEVDGVEVTVVEEDQSWIDHEFGGTNDYIGGVVEIVPEAEQSAVAHAVENGDFTAGTAVEGVGSDQESDESTGFNLRFEWLFGGTSEESSEMDNRENTVSAAVVGEINLEQVGSNHGDKEGGDAEHSSLQMKSPDELLGDPLLTPPQFDVDYSAGEMEHQQHRGGMDVLQQLGDLLDRVSLVPITFDGEGLHKYF